MKAPRERRLPPLWLYALGGLVYYASIEASIWIAGVDSALIPIWPAIGVGMWLVARFGYGMLLGFPIAEFAIAYLGIVPASWPHSLGLLTLTITGNFLTLWLGGWILRSGRRRWEASLGAFLEPVLCLSASAIGPVAGATVGAITFLVTGIVPHATFMGLWMPWWTSDCIGVLFVLPLLLSAPTLGLLLRSGSLAVLWRSVVVVCSSLVVSWLVYEVAVGGLLLFAFFPVLLLATALLGAPGARVAAFTIAATGVFATARGHGQFATGQFFDDAVTVQIFLSVVAGVALLLPALHARQNLLRRLPLTVLLAGWTLSGLLFTLLERQQERSDEKDFAELTDGAQMAIEQRVSGCSDLLRSGGAALAVSAPELGREAWRNYASAIDLTHRYAGVGGLGVVYPVRPGESQALVSRLRAEGDPGFAVRSPEGRSPDPAQEGRVLTYYEPPGAGPSAIGLDLYTDAVRRTAQDQARDTGEPRITERVAALPEARGLPGLVLYVPIYRGGVHPSSVAERREALRLWVEAPVVTQPFIRGALGGRSEELRLYMFDEGHLDVEHLVFANEDVGASLPEFSRVTVLDMAGKRLTLGWARWPGFALRNRSPLIWLAMSFILGTVLLAGWVLTLEGFRERAQSLVDERTAELRKSEALLLHTGEMAKVGGWELDLATNALSWTLETYRISEIDPAETPHMERWIGLFAPEARGVIAAALRAAKESGIPYTLELPLFTAKGQHIWVRIKGYSVMQDGRAVKLQGSIQDVTERRKSEEERDKFEKNLQETQKLESLGVLAGGIAHDFNNILTGVLGNASLASIELPSDSPAQSYLEAIRQGAVRAADLCKQMLAYSGKGRFVVRQISLNRLIEETTHLVQLSISKKAALFFNLMPELPLIEADDTQIRQVIMNLVINASEALGDAGGAITVTTGVTRVDREYLRGAVHSPELPAGSYVHLEVSDTGCGMSPETQAKIFDPFFTTKFTGRGLGLSAVLGIVGGHKGALRMYSELGRGTTFKIVFPVAAKAAEPPPKTAGAEAAYRDRGSVLVVDDEEVVRKTASQMLQKMGFDVVAAQDGLQALRIFKADPAKFALVLMDLTMPRLDGEQTYAELRRVVPDVRVVLMSGFNEQDAVARFTGRGLANFVQKPFDFQGLSQIVRSVMSGTAVER